MSDQFRVLCWFEWCDWETSIDLLLHTPEDLFNLRLEHLHQSHTAGQLTREVESLDAQLRTMNGEPPGTSLSISRFREFLLRLRTEWPA